MLDHIYESRRALAPTDMNSKERRVPKRWSEEEDCILYEETQKQELAGDTKDWHRIAAKLPGRTNKDCRKRWVNKVCGSLRKGPWNKNEDESLLDAVEKYGQRWTLVANEVGFRSPDQCAKRWQSKLNPNLEHGGWTIKEDELLLSLVREHGREWKVFQEQNYPRRSTNELKNRYTGLTRKAKTTYNRSGSVCLSPSSGSFNLDYSTDMEDPSIVGDHFDLGSHTRSPSEDSAMDSLIHQSLTVDWVNTLDNSGIWMDQFNHGHNSVVEDILPSGYMPESGDLINSEESPKRPSILHKNTAPEASECEQVSGLTNPGSWPDLVFDPEIVAQDAMIIDSSYGMNSHALGDGLLSPTQTDSGGTNCTDENIETPIESSVGRVTLVIDGCNRDTLHSLLDLTKSLKGRTKIEIN
ncbi:Homeodomain-like protein [Nemania abortiva]|nr:Homeodomain-like protein [Nemania abortiva]